MATTFEGIEVGGLPPEVRDLGRPDAVFPTKALLGTPIGMALMAGGVLLLFCGGAAIFGYMNVPFPKDGPPPEIVLGVGVFSAVFGLGLVASALRRPSGREAPDTFRGFLVYPTALVRARDGGWTVFPWDGVEALVNPETSLGDFQVLASDGRKFRVDRDVEGYMDLLGTILHRVKGARLGPARERFAAGQTVPFGPFGVSRDALVYKGKRLAWDRMSAFGVIIQNGHRHLRVKRRGALWPWCYKPLYGIPNEAIFFELIEEARSGQRYAWV